MAATPSPEHIHAWRLLIESQALVVERIEAALAERGAAPARLVRRALGGSRGAGPAPAPVTARRRGGHEPQRPVAPRRPDRGGGPAAPRGLLVGPPRHRDRPDDEGRAMLRRMWAVYGTASRAGSRPPCRSRRRWRRRWRRWSRRCGPRPSPSAEPAADGGRPLARGVARGAPRVPPGRGPRRPGRLSTTRSWAARTACWCLSRGARSTWRGWRSGGTRWSAWRSSRRSWPPTSPTGAWRWRRRRRARFAPIAPAA